MSGHVLVQVWRWLLLFDVPIEWCFCQEERHRQLGVKFTIEAQRRLRREEEEEQRQRKREEEKKEMEQRRRVAAKGIKHFKERVRISDPGNDPHAKLLINEIIDRWNVKFVSIMLQDLLKVEVKLQEKQLKEKEEADRQLRIAAKLKEKVKTLAANNVSGGWWSADSWLLIRLLLHSGGRSCQQRPHQAHSCD